MSNHSPSDPSTTDHDDPSITNHDPPPPPPSGAPPLLTFSQIQHLATQGWLSITLPPLIQTHFNALFAHGQTFFAQPLISKQTLYPPSHGTEHGFYRVPNEKEYLTFRHTRHHTSPLEDTVATLWTLVAHYLHRVLCDLSAAGGYDARKCWEDLMDGSWAMSPPSSSSSSPPALNPDIPTLLRLFTYAPHSGSSAPHIDIGLLTLCVSPSPGLELLTYPSQTYTPAPGPTILIADTLRMLLKNRVRAGMHRVVPTPEGRMSAVFALRPCLAHEVDLEVFGGRKGDVRSMREVFWRVKGRKWNVNATWEVRERQRRVQREGKAVVGERDGEGEGEARGVGDERNGMSDEMDAGERVHEVRMEREGLTGMG